MAQRRSLSGRSPFCQLKLSEKSQINWKGFFHESNKFEKTQRNKTTNHNAVSRECREGWMKPVPRAVRSRASWNAESTMSTVRGGRQRLFHRLEDAANSEKN